MHKNAPRGEASAAESTTMALGVLALCFLFNFVGRGIGDTYMVFLLPLGLLPATGQRLGNAGRDHQGLPHSAVQQFVHSV